MATLEILRERVEAGIQVLNRRDPKWFLYINLGTMQMESSFSCVLGQWERRGHDDHEDYMVDGEEPFDTGQRRLRIKHAEFYGFASVDSRMDYDHLTGLWGERIQQLQVSGPRGLREEIDGNPG
jgi:hypothetical protein